VKKNFLSLLILVVYFINIKKIKSML